MKTLKLMNPDGGWQKDCMVKNWFKTDTGDDYQRQNLMHADEDRQKVAADGQ